MGQVSQNPYFPTEGGSTPPAGHPAPGTPPPEHEQEDSSIDAIAAREVSPSNSAERKGTRPMTLVTMGSASAMIPTKRLHEISDLFQTQIRSRWSGRQEMELKLDDHGLDPATQNSFLAILRGKKVEITAENAKILFELANFYDLKDLASKTEAFMLENLSEEHLQDVQNLHRILLFALETQAPKITARLFTFLLMHSKIRRQLSALDSTLNPHGVSGHFKKFSSSFHEKSTMASEPDFKSSVEEFVWLVNECNQQVISTSLGKDGHLKVKLDPKHLRQEGIELLKNMNIVTPIKHLIFYEGRGKTEGFEKLYQFIKNPNSIELHNSKITKLPEDWEMSLQEVTCFFCALTSLKAKNAKKVDFLECPLSSLDVPNAEDIRCNSKSLTTLNAKDAKEIVLYHCPLTNLDAPNAESIKLTDCRAIAKLIVKRGCEIEGLSPGCQLIYVD